VLRRCVWSRNIKNRRSIYIYDISSLRVNCQLALRWWEFFQISFCYQHKIFLFIFGRSYYYFFPCHSSLLRTTTKRQ